MPQSASPLCLAGGFYGLPNTVAVVPFSENDCAVGDEDSCERGAAQVRGAIALSPIYGGTAKYGVGYGAAPVLTGRGRERRGRAVEMELGLEGMAEETDNITDWCLSEFQTRYDDPAITKDDIWEYLYGVMHAPDWRERYAKDLQRNLPRVPLAADFEAFRRAGRELMDLHIGYETCPEHPGVEVRVKGSLLDDLPDPSEYPGVYRIERKMRWGRNPETKKRDDRTVLEVNDRCWLVGIPPQAQEYTVSGRSPLDWAIASLRHKRNKASGITDDPNGWHVWEDNPFELIRHLRRLVYVSVRSAEIIAALPPSLSDKDEGANG